MSQSKGLDFLRPIWRMIYSNEDLYGDDSDSDSDEEDDYVPLNGLNLSESDVSVSYTHYINNYKNTAKDAQSNDKTVDDAVRNGLTPGEKPFSKKNYSLLSWNCISKRRPSRNESR